MKIKPLGNRILVKRIEAEEKTKSGLFIPDGAREKPTEGEVLAVGLGLLTETGTRVLPSVKKGDRVLFAKYTGTEVNVEDGQTVIFMEESDLLGVVEPE